MKQTELAVYIYDIDYIEKTEPNFLGMRIASYHKQRGDYVSLIGQKDKLPKKFKLLYILRRDATLSKPSVQLMYHPNVRVYGIEYFNNWEPTAAMLACRPDYGLYPRGRDKFERADAVQFTDEHGHLLPLKQDDRNVETDKDCVITDKNLWALTNQELVQAFNSLRGRKNIYFLEPISLVRINCDVSVKEAFLHLNFAKTVRLQWDNPYPFKHPYEQIVLDFFDEFKELHPRVNIGNISFYPKPKTTTDRENILLAFQFILALKRRKMLISFKPLHSRLDSPYAHAYELLRKWSENPHMSWMEVIALRGAAQLGKKVDEYYCHSEWWYDELFRAGIDLMLALNKELKEVDENWMLWQYKDHYYPVTNVNWSEFRSATLWY